MKRICPTCRKEYNRSAKQRRKGWLVYCSMKCKNSEDRLDVPNWYYKKVVKDIPTREEIQFDLKNRAEVAKKLGITQKTVD